MTSEYISVEEAARRLDLHVRTVRSYVRSGRLKAVRIGKQYRITPADLECFMGRPIDSLTPAHVKRHRNIEVTNIVQVDAVNPDEEERMTGLLIGSAPGMILGHKPVRVQTVYDPERARLKIILVGDIDGTCELMRMIDIFLSPR